jgi:glutamine amidotransferase
LRLNISFYTNTSAEFNDGTTGAHPAVYKTVAPALTDPTFLSISANISSNTIVAHVRATSLSPVVPTNCHPFTFGRHIFAHNGSISHFDQIRRPLSHLIGQKHFGDMKGTTDSEHMAALYMTHLGDDSEEKTYTVNEMRDALAKTIADVQKIQSQVLSKEVLPNSANSLNLVTSEFVI